MAPCLMQLAESDCGGEPECARSRRARGDLGRCRVPGKRWQSGDEEGESRRAENCAKEPWAIWAFIKDIALQNDHHIPSRLSNILLCSTSLIPRPSPT